MHWHHEAIEKSRRLLGFALNGQGVHPREDLLSEKSGHWGCVERVAVCKGCKRLDMSTQGEYTNSKPALENVNDFNVSKSWKVAALHVAGPSPDLRECFLFRKRQWRNQRGRRKEQRSKDSPHGTTLTLRSKVAKILH
jgi:hypothetical protein